jgi:hypothetical protein
MGVEPTEDIPNAPYGFKINLPSYGIDNQIPQITQGRTLPQYNIILSGLPQYIFLLD